MIVPSLPWTPRWPDEEVPEPRTISARLSPSGQREAQMRGLGHIRNWTFQAPPDAQQDITLTEVPSSRHFSELAVWSLLGKLHFTLDAPITTPDEVLEALIDFEHFRAEVVGVNISLAMMAAAVGALCWH